MRKRLLTLSAIGAMLVLTSIFWIGQGTADQSTVLGDVSELAECLGVEPRAGIYHVSDILCELAKRMGIGCCNECPPLSGPQPGEVIISSVLANAVGSTSSAEMPNEFISFLNIGVCSVDLRGCTFRDENASYTIPYSRSDAVLSPGGEVRFYGYEFNPTNSSQGISLRNSGETVTLECASTPIDVWRYPGGSGEGLVIYRAGY